MSALVRALCPLVSMSTIKLTFRTPDFVRKVIIMKINEQFLKFSVKIALVFIAMRISNHNFSGIFALKYSEPCKIGWRNWEWQDDSKPKACSAEWVLASTRQNLLLTATVTLASTREPSLCLTRFLYYIFRYTQ